MYIIETYSWAVACAVITMICWGSWPNARKLGRSTWRFELFYWDYVMGVLLVSSVMALTWGAHGTQGRNIWDDLQLANTSALLSAAAGGVIFNAGNILFMAAIAFAGLAVAFPVGAGLAMVLGILVNYIAVPAGSPYFLFGGMVCIVLAILLSAAAYRRQAQQLNKPPLKGILLAISAGILFGFFYRFIAASMATDFSNPQPGLLTPYTAVLFFAIGTVVSNLLFNTLLMYRPLEGKPVRYSDYFSGSLRDHFSGWLGGAIWGLGISLSILCAGKVGYAVSFGLGQCNAMIAAIWGVFVWKEFKNAPAGTNRLLYGMFACYMMGILLIIGAREN
ncbi:glucose uptake protein [Filimonas zeae]|uniref:Multidrug DMT transporter permease n=1 Tax=Filimonas zeae TaxID=1737353 RepID=A0A917MWV3_9BACT|nr:GRP family sugar transporter [Filimonas zeae]MDR6338999.1 glucose uptake protein [Filimonas zeae]GGH65593.1 multidrug DMT transporter permease [Filimonas zeae]